MQQMALGVCMHSGWGVLVAVSGDAPSLKLVDRTRFEIIDPAMPGAKQPYHHASTLPLTEAQRHLERCASVSERLATDVVGEIVRQQKGCGFSILGAAILRSAARPLPPLSKILSSHPLIHTAEGEFFRNVVASACEVLRIPVTAVRERDLDTQAKTTFGSATSRVLQTIEKLGATLGPPWTKDHKGAALAAALILAGTTDATSARPVKRIG